MITHYAKVFSVTELNYTWYQMPQTSAIERMLLRVPRNFGFAVKLNRTMTHEVDPKGWRGQASRFKEGIAPIVQNGQLMAVLIQLPPSFERTRANRLYLSHLIEDLEALPLAVEFRHKSWAKDRVFAGLEKRNIALVAVDMPELSYLFPCLDVVTSTDLFYIRFHGRNTRGWHAGNMQIQFDYDYCEQELREWSEHRIPKMVDQASTGLIFFNNHVRGQAPDNAQLMIAQFKNQGMI